MTDNRPIVEGFLDALAEGRTSAALALLADDVTWRNTGLPTVRGQRVHQMLAEMEQRGIEFAVEMNHIAQADDGTVLTDRWDVLGWRALRSRFWVCGTFTLADGLITDWHDHFATANVLKGLALGVAGAR